VARNTGMSHQQPVPYFFLWLKVPTRLDSSGSFFVFYTLCVAPMPMHVIKFVWFFSCNLSIISSFHRLKLSKLQKAKRKF
jgi:hypothetical protein